MTCARQYEEIKVLRHFQDQKNEASIWGDEVHREFEKYLQLGGGELGRAALPTTMHAHIPYLDSYLARPGQLLVEQEYGLNLQLQPCEFLGRDVWMRGIIDVLTLDGDAAWVDDHKTGNNRKKDMQQLVIFALLTFYHHPQVQTAHCAFHWLQLGAQDTETFTRDQIPYLWSTLTPKLQLYRRAFALGVFPPKPSGLCKRHCAVTTCEYHGGR